MSKAIKGIGRAVSKVVKGIGKGIKKLASSTLGKVVLTVAAGFILGPAVGSLMQSAGGALAAGAVEGSLAQVVGSGLSSVGSAIGGTGAAAGTGLSGALEAAASSVTTSVGNAVSGVQGLINGAPVQQATPGWVSAEGGTGYANGMAAEPMRAAAEVAQSNIPASLADRPPGFQATPEPGTLRATTTQGLQVPQQAPIRPTGSGSSGGWINQIMNDSRAKSALITGGIQVGGGLIAGYGQAKAAQSAYDRERERIRRNLDVSGVRV